MAVYVSMMLSPFVPPFPSYPQSAPFYKSVLFFCVFITVLQVGYQWGFPCRSVGKESAYNAGDSGLIPGSERSPGEGNGNPHKYSCLEKPMERGAWQATVHGVTRVRHNLVTKPPPPPSF